MSLHDYRILIDHGRKAGLKTSELYPALQGQLPAPVESAGARTDSNGYETVYGPAGQVVYQPQTRPECK